MSERVFRGLASDGLSLTPEQQQVLWSASPENPVFLEWVYDDLPGPSLMVRQKVTAVWIDGSSE